MRLISLLLFTMLGASILRLSAVNSGFFYYKQLGVKEGLSQSKVQAILNDHQGYLWIGTEAGLNRYDNYHLKQYLHYPEDTTSLPSNEILFVAEDALYNLWVATKAGMCLYDPQNDSFKKVSTSTDKEIYASSYLLVDDGIVFGGKSCIYKFKYSTKEWEMYAFEHLLPKNISFRKMVRYNNRILINTQWYGIYSFDSETKQLTKIEEFSADNYSTIYVDRKHCLWVSPYGKGLFCYEDGKLVRQFSSKNSALTYDVIHDIIEKENQLWIATDGGGVNILSLDDFSFSHINEVRDDLSSFPTNAIYRIYCDATGNIWAGSVYHGLIGIKRTCAHTYQQVPFNNSFGLSSQVVRTLFQDDEGMLWIGTEGGGINRFDPVAGTFKHYATTKNEKITSIVDFNSHELLFFSFDKGLCLLNKQSGNVRPFSVVDWTANELFYISGVTVRLKRLSSNKILISGKRVYIYDITTRQIEQIGGNEKHIWRYAPIIIGVKETKIYLADWRYICEYDLETKKINTIYQGKQVINDACIDSNGKLWIASPDGVISYDIATQKTDILSTELFHEATSVIADNSHRVWIGTRRNLYLYSTEEDKIIMLDDMDGVLPNEYLSSSHLLLHNGDIVLGGINGMTYLNANIRFAPEDECRIKLLDVLLNGRTVALNEPDEEVGTIRIPWNFSSLQLKVLLDSKNIFKKNIFHFYVRSDNQQLLFLESNSLNINYLPVGEYAINSSYYTRNGKWSEEQEILRLLVTPPWWKTNAFYAGIGALTCILLWGAIYVYNRRKKIKQHREIVKLKNKMYEDKITFLTNISHELRTPLTLICAPLKRIIRHETNKEKEEQQLVSIYQQAYQMKNIIDMVLDVRKMEEGKSILHILPHGLNEWVHGIGDKFVMEFELRKIQLVYELDDNIQDIFFDDSKCEFVLSNFLMNALKFSKDETAVIIRTELSFDGQWAKVSVADLGMGLNMADTNALFTNFYQGDHDKGGSGIGLSYAKSIITSHKGRIGAMDNQGSGAVFYFELPVEPGESVMDLPIIPKKTEVDETIVHDYLFLINFTVVVVEDTTDLRNYLKETLSTYFTKVYVAKDGEEGLELIRQKQPDVILCDVMMPKMNGFELCYAVKTDLEISHIPFILLTAYHEPQNMYTGYKTGADVFLPKPFDVDALLVLMYNQLKLRESIKGRYNNKQILTVQEMSFSNADENFLLKLNNLITEHLSNSELDVHFLASNMCISRSLLFKKIKSLTGMGIIDYVNRQRIEKALLLLAGTSNSLTEISEMVGFSSLQYFRKVFKSIKGVTPSEYKKQLNEKPEK